MSLSLLLLGAGSGLCWGTADFFGGLQARRIPALSVTLWSQVAGGVVLLAVTLAAGQRPTTAGLLWGAAAGVFGGFALLSFYRGLAVGAMSIVAPVSACGALVPVFVSLVSGHRPSLVATIGIAAAMSGIILVSLQSDVDTHPSRKPRLAIGLALMAAMGFGGFYVLLNHAGQGLSTQLWPVVGVRAGSLTLLLALILVARQPAPWPGRRLPFVAAVGLVDTLANVLWVYAATRGNLGIAAVLGSLYPVSTVVLGRIILSERLTPVQFGGVVLALTGVALVSR